MRPCAWPSVNASAEGRRPVARLLAAVPRGSGEQTADSATTATALPARAEAARVVVRIADSAAGASAAATRFGDRQWDADVRPGTPGSAPLGPRCGGGDVGQQRACSLVVGRVEPQQRPAQLVRFGEVPEAPGAERQAVQAAEEGAVVDPSPAEHATEVLRQRAFRDSHAGRVMRLRRRRVVVLEREASQVRVRVDAARVPFDQSLQ